MKRIVVKNNFEKDLKKIHKNPKFDRDLLNHLIDLLAKGETLPAKYRDHKLAKQSPNGRNECRDFHLSPNIAVIYKLAPDEIELIRIGSHSYLGLTENLVD